MSYLESLDDIPTSQLREEIARRDHSLAYCQCPYCHQPLNTHTCKYASLDDSNSPEPNRPRETRKGG